jgi:hypothetical protein
MTKRADAVPRYYPTSITVRERDTSLRIRHRSGYIEIDQILLTSSVHDLPAPEAAWFKPVDKYRFERPGSP